MQDSVFSAGKAYLFLASKWLQLIGTALVSSHSWLSAADFTSAGFIGWPNLVTDLLSKYKGSGYLSWVFAFGLGLFVLGFFGQKIRSPKDWKLIQFMLDRAQEIAYPNTIGDPKHFHRVTLFRYQKWANVHHWSKKKLWRWGAMAPWSGWLVPVCRSGHTSKTTKTKFAALQNGNCEGICGLSWSTDSGKVVQNLPAVRTGNRTNRAKYASATNCCKEMIDHMLDGTDDAKSAPMSIGAIPVRVSGELWGVLVFDSQAPEGVKTTIASDFQITVGAIEKILEKDL